MRSVALLLALVVAFAAPAHADTKRVAVVVGNNVGSGAQPALHFAETDASKLARVLVELGGVRSEDLVLLQGRSVKELEQAMALTRRRVADYQRGTNRVMVVFYFSGHSDGEALELGTDRLAFGDLRRWLVSTGADVRLALVDSCKSGALLRAKGGTPGPAFQIRLTDELASTGEVLLTSSAADELALESQDLRGSFFTHHLVSGLRGAADSSGDGLVTLVEAYQYAYVHTLRTTGATVIGPQHPAYDYRLAGRGDLILTDLVSTSGSRATIELPRGFQRALVMQDHVIAELTSDVRNAVTVQPGPYAVYLWKDGKSLAAKITVANGERRIVRWDELSVSALPVTRAKGEASSPLRLGVAGGISRGTANELGAIPSLRTELRSSRWFAGATVSSGRGEMFRETSAIAFGGYRLGIQRGAFEAWAGLELGGGGIWQTIEGRASNASAAGYIGPTGGALWRIGDRYSLALTSQLQASVMKRDGELALQPGWATWFGVVIDL
ncbi:MAG: caspase family protein [Myxococcota bacterium]|nr:caspase family protein [Myxococcota bacterium]